MEHSDYLKIKELIEPVQTADELNNYIIKHFNIEFPWDIVDEESTSSSLKFIWQIYKTMLTGEGSHRHVVAAARGTAKTLSTAILQYFSLVHFRRDGLHLASTRDQSYALIGYIDKFLRNPILSSFTDTDSVSMKKLNLPPNDFTLKQDAKLQVAAATKKGTNSQRASCFEGKTKITVYREIPRKDGSQYNYYTMDGLYKRINNGEKIYALSVNNKTGELEKKRITHAMRREEPERLEITLKSGKVIRCTKDHLLTSGYDGEIQYTAAGEMKVGDSTFIKNNNKIQLDEIVNIKPYIVKNPKSRERWVYDITIEDNHNFFANGVLAHNCLSFDEVDLTPPEILSEAAMIADPSTIYRPNGEVVKFNTMFIYLSSRKTNEGPLQELIDEAESPSKTQMTVRLHKWSSVDWMEKCPEEVYNPDNPEKCFVNTETLETIWSKEKFEDKIPISLRNSYKEYDAFENCQKCPALMSCLGRSCKQRSESFMLRSRDWVGGMLASTKSASAILAQILNWKPETAGIVFNTFSPVKHVKAPYDFYEWCIGEKYNPKNLTDDEYQRRVDLDCTYQELKDITPTKEEIYTALKESGYMIIAGVDWGFSPDPATVLVGAYHKKRKRFAVLHCDSGHNYSNDAWAEYCSKNVFNRFPVQFVAPDQADNASNTYFARNKIRSLGPKDKPARIATGVSQIRGLLFNPNTQDINFCVLDDSQEEDQNKQVIYEMQHWTHAKDAIGRWRSDKFDEHNNNHFLDAMRYVLHPFLKNVQISISISDSTGYESIQQKQAQELEQQKLDMQKQLNSYFQEEHGLKNALKTQTPQGEKDNNTSGGIKFSF